MVIVLAIGSGVAIGWVACHYLVVRHLIWTLRDLRRESFTYDGPRDALKPAIKGRAWEEVDET